MSIIPISGVSAVTPSSYLSGVSGVQAPSSTGTVTGAQGESGFATSFAGSIDSLQSMQANADSLAVKAVTGNLDDVHDYTIAASQASMSLELTAALRNKAIEAFSEIMRMQA